MCIHLLFQLAAWLIPSTHRLQTWRPWQRSLLFAGIPLLGLGIRWPPGMQLAGHDLLLRLSRDDGARCVVGTVLLALLWTFLMNQFFAAKARQVDAERRASEAPLRLLQGQIVQ